MALRIITGVPGAGKTNYAVQHLLNTYFEWSEATDSWVSKTEGLVIITNIDGFPYCSTLESEISLAGSLEQFFHYDYQASRFAGKKVIYLIDEAQHMFPFRFYNVDVFLFFQKHRHLGFDIYLLTQDADLLAKGLRALAEFHIEAVRRTYSFAGEFRYRFVDPTTKEVWKTKILKRDRRVFAFYKSMETTETETQPSAPRRQFLLCAVIFGCCVLAFTYLLSGGRIFNRGKAIASDTEAETESKAVGSTVSQSVNGSPGVPPISSDKKLSRTPASQGSVVPAAVAEITGIYSLGKETLFLVTAGERSMRLNPDQLERVCRCSPEFMFLGSVFEIKRSEIEQENSLFYLSNIAGRGRHGSSAPAPTQAVK